MKGWWPRTGGWGSKCGSAALDPSTIQHPPCRFSPASVSGLKSPASSRCRSCGFTLMEILVVIVVIGVMVSIATLSVNVLGRDREAEDQARRLWAVLRQAQEESELQGLDTGMFATTEGYQFLHFNPRENRWLPIENDSLFAPRKLPDGLELRLWLESREIVLRPSAPNREDKDEDKKWPPQIMVLSSGDVMPFELRMERDGTEALWRVTATPDGDLRIERRDAAALSQWVLIEQTRPPEQKDARSAANAKR
jgi:general secretion pathway protein H